jgi:hypothetical protein
MGHFAKRPGLIKADLHSGFVAIDCRSAWVLGADVIGTPHDLCPITARGDRSDVWQARGRSRDHVSGHGFR